MLRLLAIGLATLLCASTALAGSDLEKWRSDITAARMLAENDVQQALRQATRLQQNTPADAMPADRARVLNLLSRTEVYGALTEQAEKHARLALDIATQSGDRAGQAEAQLNIAMNAVNQARIDASVAATARSVELLDGVDKPELLGEALLRMSMMYRRLSDLDNSVTMAMQAMEIARRSNNPMALTYAYQGIAISYEQSSHYNEAFDNYRKMRDQARAAHSKLLEAHAIGGMALTARQLGEFKDSEHLMREAISMFRSLHAPFSLNFGLFGLADTLRQQGKYQQAVSTLDEVIANYEKYPNPIGLWFTLNARSQNLQALHRIDDARTDANKAYELAKKIGLPVYLGGSARRLSEIFSAEGDYRLAYRYSTEAANMSEQAARQKTSSRMIELAQRYETDSKQRQINELKRHNEQQDARQRWLWTVLGGSAALLATTSYFLIRLRRSRREIQRLNLSLEQRIQERTDELRQQTRYLRTLFDTLPVSVWLKDTAGRYLTINTCQVALDGVTAEQMIGRTDEEIWPGEIGTAFRAVDIEVMDTRCRKLQELAIRGDGGVICWREIDKAPVFDEDGTLLGTVGVGRDISERKRYEQSLLEQAKLERRLTSVAANIPGFIFTFRAEPDGHISLPFASAGLENMFGLTSDKASEDAGALLALCHTEDLPCILALIDESRQSLTPFNMELRMFNRDDAEHWMAIHAIPMRQSDGSTEWNGIMLDITERKNMEEALAVRERELRALAESSPGMVGSFHIRPDGSVCMPYVSSNIYDLFGLLPQQVAEDASDLMRLNHPDDAEQVQESIAESARTLKPWHTEYRILHPVKGERWMEGHTNPQPHPDGGTIWYGYVHDITERKLAEQKLKEALEFNEGVINAIPDLLFEMDKSGRYLNLWTHTPELLVTQKQFLLGNTVQDVLSPECAAVVMDALSEAGENGVSFGKVIQFDLSEGANWFELSVSKKPGHEVFLVLSRNISERKRMESELLESHNFLNRIIDSISDPIFVKDRAHRWILSNESFCNLIGQPRENLLGKTDYDFIPKEQSDVFWEKDELVFNSGQMNVNEEAITGTSGQTRYLHTKKTPFVSVDGQALLVGVIRDITERKQMEETLRSKEEKLSNLFELSPLGIALTDMRGRFIEFNEAFRKICGYSAEELMTLDYWTLTPKEYEASELKQLALLANTGRYGPYEKEYRQKHGQLIPLRLNGVLLKKGDGKDYIWSFVEDITERKRMEEALAEREREFRSLAENSPDPIFRYDRECRRTYVNPVISRLSGHPVEALISKTPAGGQLLANAEALKLSAGIRRVFDSEEAVCIDLVFVDRHGSQRVFQTLLVPELDREGYVATVLGLARDISERKATEAAREAALIEAERLVRSRSEFIAQMSHELRTPLNGILGYAQILGRDKKLDERQIAGVNVIRKSGEHLLTLINDILDFAKIEAGKIKIVPSDVQLEKFLRTITEILRIKADQKRIEFVCIQAPDIPAWINIDEKRLRQVLLNLLSNAVKFTDRGCVSLKVEKRPSGRLRFEVQDTGIGIDLEQIETIFQPFEQLGDQRHRHGGTGLGLPISRQFIRLMGSEIHVESRPGQGSKFWFELAASSHVPDMAAALPMRNPTGYAGARRTILVADDMDENREILTMMLNEIGFNMIEAHDGIEAVKKAQAGQPDLLLIDSLMPLMDGLEATRSLRQTPGFETLPIIAVSASASREDEAHCLLNGADAFLPKPVDMMQLLAKIAELLRLEWIYEPEALPQAAPLASPPQSEIRTLYQLALMGDMRDILLHCDHIAEMSALYRPFADHLRTLAQEYQTRAALKFVEQHLKKEPE